jgi:hypothetical protein
MQRCERSVGLEIVRAEEGAGRPKSATGQGKDELAPSVVRAAGICRERAGDRSATSPKLDRPPAYFPTLPPTPTGWPPRRPSKRSILPMQTAKQPRPIGTPGGAGSRARQAIDMPRHEQGWLQVRRPDAAGQLERPSCVFPLRPSALTPHPTPAQHADNSRAPAAAAAAAAAARSRPGRQLPAQAPAQAQGLARRRLPPCSQHHSRRRGCAGGGSCVRQPRLPPALHGQGKLQRGGGALRVPLRVCRARVRGGAAAGLQVGWPAAGTAGQGRCRAQEEPRAGRPRPAHHKQAHAPASQPASEPAHEPAHPGRFPLALLGAAAAVSRAQARGLARRGRQLL